MLLYRLMELIYLISLPIWSMYVMHLHIIGGEETVEKKENGKGIGKKERKRKGKGKEL